MRGKKKKRKDCWRISSRFLEADTLSVPPPRTNMDRGADSEGESRALFEFEIKEAREFICLCRLFLRGAVEVSFI